MTTAKHRKSVELDSANQSLQDPHVRAYTLMIGLTRSGICTVVVGKRDMKANKYSFLRAGDLAVGDAARGKLLDLLLTAFDACAQDEELQAW